jgi:D-serine deaminase-like pyridoxal phosphate-dependent protein
MLVSGLETPVPVVDLDVLEANLARMQAYCDKHRLQLRPHIKTHKSPEIAKMQLAQGAIGITCQKLTEAEVMADAGLTDIHLSYPIVGVGKAHRLANLATRVSVSVSVDSDEGMDVAAEAAAMARHPIGIKIDIDAGAGRTGVQTAEEALRLARRALDTPFLEFAGLITYPITPDSGPFFARAQAVFREAGVPIPGFSAAGTPSAWQSHLVEGLTEVRHGSYVFNDRTSVGEGAAGLDNCALHVLATVVSRPTPERAILDAGSKSLSSDRVADTIGIGHGLIRQYPNAVIERLYEEHAVVRVPADLDGLRIGERVRILPNHVCVVVNLHNELVAIRQDVVEKHIQIAARGKTR